MKKLLLALFAFCSASVAAAQTQTNLLESSTTPRVAQESRTFFPHNWIRGYSDFEVAPSHNEPDLGRCMFPQPTTAGGTASTCSAYARYLFSGYIEFQPLG